MSDGRIVPVLKSPTQEMLEYEDPGKYMDWEIGEVIDILTDKAKELGEHHSQIMQAKGRGPTPNAYRATTYWKAVEIIQELQATVKELKAAK